MSDAGAASSVRSACLAKLFLGKRAGAEARPYESHSMDDARLVAVTQRKAGRTGPQRGITLVELMVAMAIIALMMAIAFPSLTAGLDGIRLRTDVDRAGTFFSRARLAADQRQQPVQLTADPETGELRALSADGAWEESLAFSDNIQIAVPRQTRSWILHPGTPAPRFRLLLANERGGRSGLSINIFTGVPEDWNPGEDSEQ